MNAQRCSSMSSELEKLSSMPKEAVYETARTFLSGAKAALFGGTKLHAPAGMFHPERQAAATLGQDLMSHMGQAGLPVHRARIKTPASMSAKGILPEHGVPDDLLGMQVYGKGPEHVQTVMDTLRAKGVQDVSARMRMRPGYHGVNISGTHVSPEGMRIPVEVQVHPSRLSTVGNVQEHALGYKPKTEAPHSNFVDRWWGKNVAPRMVAATSWIPERQHQLAAMGVTR